MKRWTWTCLLFWARAVCASPMPAPTYCAEWVRQSTEGYERVTLFSDGVLVWKTRRGEVEDLRRKALEPEEAKFYCEYFAGAGFWALPEDLRSRMTGQFATQSVLRLARPDGSTKEIRFDELSPLSPDASALRSSLEGLKQMFAERIAPASKFTAQTLAPGTVLKRLDGALFRVVRLDEAKGIVELEGLSEPFSIFRKIEDLRFFFHAPGQ
jgi:hypothetical protein